MGKRKGSHILLGRMAALGLVVAVGMALGGCGASSKKSAGGANSAPMAVSPQAAPAEAAGQMQGNGAIFTSESKAEMGVAMDSGSGANAGGSGAGNMGAAMADPGRKLIRTVNLSVETKELDALMETVAEQTKALGGYIEAMETYNGSSYNYVERSYRRNANLTIRVPKEKLDGFLETVYGISNVVRRAENVEDVTLAYVDLDSHKKALTVEQERLMALLEKADTIENILSIEKRLSEVRYQLESMESQLRTYDNQIDYATVHLDVSEVKELTPVQEKTAWQRMGDGFVESIRDIKEGLQESGIQFVVHTPYLASLAAVVLAAILSVRGTIKRRRLKKAKKIAAQGENKE